MSVLERIDLDCRFLIDTKVVGLIIGLDIITKGPGASDVPAQAGGRKGVITESTRQSGLPFLLYHLV